MNAHDRFERAIYYFTFTALGVIGVLAATRSAVALGDLANRKGWGDLAFVLPATLDGMALVGTLMAVVRARQGRGAGLAWWTVAAALGASIAGNVAHALEVMPDDLVSALISGTPPVVWAVVTGLTMHYLRNDRTHTAHPQEEMNGQDRDPREAHPRPGDPLPHVEGGPLGGRPADGEEHGSRQPARTPAGSRGVDTHPDVSSDDEPVHEPSHEPAHAFTFTPMKVSDAVKVSVGERDPHDITAAQILTQVCELVGRDVSSGTVGNELTKARKQRATNGGVKVR